MKKVDFPQAPILVLDDYFTATELQHIWAELDVLVRPHKMQTPEQTSAATHNGVSMKRAAGLFLDEVYGQRCVSDILRITRKIFDGQVQELAKTVSPLYAIMANTNLDYTLLNYYQDGDYYQPHRDNAVFTAVTMLFREPASYDGGDLAFPEFSCLVEKKNNRLVLFPSVYVHEVSPVTMSDITPFNGLGRYTLSQFMYVLNKND